jgi:glutamate carboxypeptidase
MKASSRRAIHSRSPATSADEVLTRTRQHAAEFAAARAEMLALLGRLVAIESPSSSAEGVNGVAAELAGLLSEAGFEIIRELVPAHGNKVTAVRRFGDGPNVLIVGHTDTVWPLGTLAGWPYRCSETAASGPGAGDMKSSLVMAPHALRLLSNRRPHGLGEVRLLLVPDEEMGSPSSREWIERSARSADVCLGLEPGRPGGGVVVARGAVGALVISARGVSAHTTAPEAGKSALTALAPLVASLENLSRREQGTIVTVGILHGGVARQVVPAHAEMHVDLRAPTSSAADMLLARVLEVLEDAPGSADITVRGGITRPSFVLSAASGSLYQFAAAAGAAVGLGSYQMRERGGGDSSFAGAQGIPTLDGLGPLVHHPCSRDEWVDVSSLASRGAMLVSLLEYIAARGTGLGGARTGPLT